MDEFMSLSWLQLPAAAQRSTTRVTPENSSSPTSWIFDTVREDHYLRKYDQKLGQWVTLWRRGLSPEITQTKGIIESSADSDTHIVKNGTEYTHFINDQGAEVDGFVSKKRTIGQPLNSSSIADDDNAAPGDLLHMPLKGNHDMRVLELHPGGSEDQLDGCLHICSVDFEYPMDEDGRTRSQTLHAMSCDSGSPVWYTALSYVWGDPALVKSMKCNGKPFGITKNLEIALLHLRRSDVSIMLWVDQICINQDDLQEKSQQVILMGTIYRRAWSTLVWLGEEADNSNEALETLLATKDALRNYPDGRTPNAEDFERLFLPASDSQKWGELGTLMGRPWFQRIWVMQEAVLSHQINVMCGTKCISWADLTLSTECIIDNDLEQYLYGRATQLEKDVLESGCMRTSKIDRIKTYNAGSPMKTTFLDGLVEVRSAQATNPRDKVFAVMGLTSVSLYPDYSKRSIDVYIEAASRIAATPDICDLLCCVDHLQPVPGLPSWVPDWASPRQTVSLGYGARFHKVYQAGKETRTHSNIVQTDAGIVLVITGIIFDTIGNVGMISEKPDLKDVLVTGTSTNSFVLEGMKLAIELSQPYPSAKWTLFQAFCQTLVAGKDSSNIAKAPDEFLPIFALLLDTATGLSPAFPDQPPAAAKRKLTLDNLRVRNPARTYRRMQVAMKAAVKKRRMGVTTQRYLGLFPRGTRIGDRVCVLTGGCVPFVIRQHERRNGYQLVGECYLHGIMDGEVEDMEGMPRVDIHLI